jgi:hypothetical protein
MAVLSNSFLISYTIGSSMFETQPLPGSYLGTLNSGTVPAVLTLQTMPDILFQNKMGNVPDRQSWS